jgi:pimeloyl-ACP methyl ester carboxylesterase
MYVEVLPANTGSPAHVPIVFLHGGGHTGACYRDTPDGRQGWAEFVAQRGWPAVVPDWPGHGRSRTLPDLARMSGAHVIDAVRELLRQVGPAVLVTHSMSGAFGWKLAEQIPHCLRALVAVAPSPPGNIQPYWSWPAYPEDKPICFTPDEVRHFTASPRFPSESFDAYFASLVPESARIYNERLNARGLQLRVDHPEVVRSLPILVVSAEQDPNHRDDTDARTAAFFGAEHLVLAQEGLGGHGHVMMIEHGNDQIVARILDWLERTAEHTPHTEDA